MYLTLQYPFIGVLLQQNEDSDFVIRKLDIDSISKGLNLQVGDVIEEIDGHPPSEYHTVKKWKSVEQAHSIVVLRSGEHIQVTISKNLMGTTDIFPMLGGFLCLLFAGMIFQRLRSSSSGRYLSFVFLNIGLIFISLGASIRGDSLGKVCINGLMMVFPVLFLHFLFVFFEEKGKLRTPKKILKYIYGVILLAILPYASYLVPSYSYFYYEIGTNIVISIFLMGIILNFVFLGYYYFKYRRLGTVISTIVRTVWWSLFISFFPFCAFSFIPLLFLRHDWISPLITSWFVLFFPISFAYLILSKQLYDIDVVLRRALFTVLLSLLPAAAIAGLNMLLFQPEDSITLLLLSFILAVAIISTILYSLEYLTTKLEKIMFPRKYHLQNALRSIAVNLQTISSFGELKEIILVDIVNTLQVYGAAIVFKYNDTVEKVIAGDIQSDELEQIAVLGNWQHPSHWCLEINHHEEYTSYLIITRKRAGTVLVAEELQWLNLIISYLAVSLENLHLIRKLNVRLQQLASQIPNEQASQDFIWFRKLMFELQETERKRIATDLHDTTLQDLFFLKKRFTSVVNGYPFNKEEQEKLNGIIEYVEIINTNLRQSCFELHPHLLHEIGLIRTVEKVVEKESALCPFRLEFYAEGAEVIELWDMEAKRHVFRIIQELLNNAKKHSEASFVSFKIKLTADGIQLFYEDDGIGLTIKDNEERQIGASGMGMEQMKSRVLHLNGSFEMDTSRDKGITVSITLPHRKVLTA